MGIISEDRKCGLSNCHRGCDKVPLWTAEKPLIQGLAQRKGWVKAVHSCVTSTLLL